jgi:hypothetical protein
MKTTFIDYSRHYYELVAHEPLPPRRTGKLVQLWHAPSGADGEDPADEYIVVAPKALAVYHANIVQRFLDERRVPGAYNAKRDAYRHHDPTWTVVGGGRFDLDDDARTLRLYGESLGYGPFERPGLAARLATYPTLTGYRIDVE